MRFLKQAVKRPKETGAIAPSSRQLADLAIREARLEGARTVVELGPGTGSFTGPLLEALAADARYLGIEINEEFAKALRARFPQARFELGSAEKIGDYLNGMDVDSCDRVISGIPWSFMKKGERETVLEAVVAALAPDGIFVTFAYFPLNHLKPGKEVLDDLHRHFGSVRKSEIVYTNVPPAFVYVCRK